MTLEEFNQQYTWDDKYISDLCEFAADNDIEWFYDFYDQDRTDDVINDNCDECLNECGWASLRDYLYDIPTGYDYYHFDGWFPTEGYDECERDFNRIKNIILENMDGYWDEEPEEEEETTEETPAPVETHEEEIKEEDMFEMNALDGLYSASSGIMQIITVKPKQEPQPVMAEREIVLDDGDLLF